MKKTVILIIIPLLFILSSCSVKNNNAEDKPLASETTSALIQVSEDNTFPFDTKDIIKISIDFYDENNERKEIILNDGQFSECITLLSNGCEAIAIEEFANKLDHNDTSVKIICFDKNNKEYSYNLLSNKTSMYNTNTILNCEEFINKIINICNLEIVSRKDFTNILKAEYYTYNEDTSQYSLVKSIIDENVCNSLGKLLIGSGFDNNIQYNPKNEFHDKIKIFYNDSFYEFYVENMEDNILFYNGISISLPSWINTLDILFELNTKDELNLFDEHFKSISVDGDIHSFDIDNDGKEDTVSLELINLRGNTTPYDGTISISKYGTFVLNVNDEKIELSSSKPIPYAYIFEDSGLIALCEMGDGVNYTTYLYKYTDNQLIQICSFYDLIVNDSMQFNDNFLINPYKYIKVENNLMSKFHCWYAPKGFSYNGEELSYKGYISMNNYFCTVEKDLPIKNNMYSNDNNITIKKGSNVQLCYTTIDEKYVFIKDDFGNNGWIEIENGMILSINEAIMNVFSGLSFWN